ncbi:extracellular solute-binding protein [Actinomadura parmotrematis]|uniref:Extracellular solute-binding protein n=1 Tax=Actinomadura parmotrematis TaxID=2864039 RepID=A0ABS7G2H2_9ACTN|nr:extracellular solute-binding protein [Actinomadura parmotrematis]MBW8485843.1 extracellular solute-binding protein [Actinomadura parmotrematis]
MILRTRPAALALAAAALLAGCQAGAADDGAGDAGDAEVPQLAQQQAVGAGEGVLNLVAPPGYAESTPAKGRPRTWVSAFSRATGCRVVARTAGSPEVLVALLKTGRYDGAAVGGDMALRLVHDGDAAPVNTGLVAGYAAVSPFLKGQPYNSVNAQPYTVPATYDANYLLYRTDRFSRPPASSAALWDAASPAAGSLALPDSPLAIADAALYLRAHRPEFGIRDPFALNDAQFTAAVSLLARRRADVARFWRRPQDVLAAVRAGDVQAGLAPASAVERARALRTPVASAIPAEGATGSADGWMVSAKARHPSCMYRWMSWVTAPKVQARLARRLGRAPANPLACRYVPRGYCAARHAGDAAFYQRLSMWRTPMRTCGEGTCADYARWAEAWARIKG